jgi:hypothetical protein
MTEDARRISQQGDRALGATEDMADTLREGVARMQVMARLLQDAADTSIGAISEVTRRSGGQVMQGFGPADGELSGLTTEMLKNLRAVAETSTALAHAFDGVSREWFRLSQRRLQRNLDGFNALVRCRSTTEFLGVQSSLVLDNLEQSVQASRLVAEMAIRMADEAMRTIGIQPENTSVEVDRSPHVFRRASRVA